MPRWVVVGGGSAGCVVAARLSERSDHEVVVLEAGPDHGSISAAADVGPLLTDPTRLRSDAVTRRAGGPTTAYLRGHGLGGSSLVNGGVITDPATPTDGLLPTEEPWAVGAVGAALLASDDVARRVRLVRRARERVTAADAYLRPALTRPNLIVRTGVDVRSVVLAGTQVVGVRTRDHDVVDADHVVLCAGAIHSPAILLRTGIGGSGVGEGLQDHPAFTITLRLRNDVIDASVPTVAVAANHPDHQVVALNHIAGSPGLGALVVALTAPLSRGSVRLPDPAGRPVVELDELGNERDLDRLTGAVADVVARLDHAAWRAVCDAVYADDRGTPLAAVATTEASLRAWITDHLSGHFHASATCADGIVTDEGRVRGCSGLYVADASSLASLPPHDPYLHVIANAGRLAANWR